MWKVMTKQEFHDAYMLEIERLQDELIGFNHEIERIERNRLRHADRIAELMETAKLFE